MSSDDLLRRDILDEVAAARKLVARALRGDHRRPGRLTKLANSLNMWWAVTGDREALAEAVTCAREAVTLTPEGRDRPAWLNNLGNQLSNWYAFTGDRASLMEAVDCGREAVALTPSHHHDRPAFLSNLGNHLGSLFAVTGEIKPLREAIRFTREAVELAPEGDSDRPTFLSNLGIHLRDWYLLTGERGALAEAIECAQKAVDLTRVGADERPGYLHNLANQLGDWFDLTGEESPLADAIKADQEAIDLTHEGHPDLPGYFNGLGLLLWERYVLTGAKDDLRHAIECSREAVKRMPAGHSDRPAVVNNLGNILSAWHALTGDREELAEAIRCGRDAVAATTADNYDRPAWLYNLGNHLSDWYTLTGERGALTEAITCAREAVAFHRRGPEGAPPTVLRTLHVSLARHLLLRDEGSDWEEAGRHLAIALQQQNDELSRQRGERSGLDYLRDKEHVYRLIVQCSLELARRHEQQGQHSEAAALREQAWSAAEQGKGRLFASMLAAERQSGDDSDAPRVAELLSLIDAVRREAAALETERDAPVSKPARRSRLRRSRTLSERALRYAGELEALDPELASLTAIRPTTLAQLQAVLPWGARLLELYPLAHDLVIFAIDHDSLRVGTAPITRDQLITWTYQLDSQVQSPKWIRRPAQRAHHLRTLLNELAASLGPSLLDLLGRPRALPPSAAAPELILVPTGPLHRWPLHLLPWGEGTLWDGFSISYVPTADTLVYCAGRRPGVEEQPLLLAPDPGLPGSFVEALLAGAAGWAAAVHQAATPEALVGSQGSVALVTHVDANPQQGGRSAIKLCRDGQLGWVTAIEILKLLRDRPPAEHGELGSCAAHYEEARAGDHLQGLTRSFLRAGFRSLTTTLWPVDDLAACYLGARTRGLMAAQDRSKAACLRQAALELRNHGWKEAAQWLEGRIPAKGPGRRLLLAWAAGYRRAAGDSAGFRTMWNECQAAEAEEGPYSAAIAPLMRDLTEWAAWLDRCTGDEDCHTMAQDLTELHWGPHVLIGDSQFASRSPSYSSADNLLEFLGDERKQSVKVRTVRRISGHAVEGRHPLV